MLLLVEYFDALLAWQINMGKIESSIHHCVSRELQDLLLVLQLLALM